MFRKLFSIGAAGAMAAAAMVATPTMADAQRYYGGDGYSGRGSYARGYDGYRGDRYRGGDRYYGRGYYADRGGRGGRYYGGRGRCRDKGTGGTIIGAIAGGLLGHEVTDGGRYGRGDGTTGAIVGAGVGALAGRAIDRNC